MKRANSNSNIEKTNIQNFVLTEITSDDNSIVYQKNTTNDN